jgi:hypothetical protein
MSHDDSGHFEFDKSYDLVSSQYWFKGMRLFVRKYVDNCLNCQPIHKTPVPFHTVDIGHLGPCVKTKARNTQLFLIIDAFKKFILLYPVKSTKSKLAIKYLQDMIKRFVVASKPKFISMLLPRPAVMAKWRGLIGLFLIPSQPWVPIDDDCWDENIHNGLNGTLNKAVGVSPSEASMRFRVVSGGLMEPEERTSLDVTEIRARLVAHTERYQASQLVLRIPVLLVYRPNTVQ